MLKKDSRPVIGRTIAQAPLAAVVMWGLAGMSAGADPLDLPGEVPTLRSI